MADLKRLDSLTEYQLTNSIEKAASKALASQGDRSQILANQLTEDNIPKHLTKTATQAFNRRISVITIGKRDESTKADDFPLADFNKVASLRGCNMDEMKKKASVQAPFVFMVEKPVMKKAASAPVEVAEPVFSSPQKVLRKLQSYITKQQTEFLDKQIELSREIEQLNRMIKKAASMIDQDVRISRQLATVYGDTYQKLFSGKVNPEALKKSAAYAILPKTHLTEYVQKTIEQADVVATKSDLLMLKRASVERALKEISDIEPKLKEACLNKEAGVGYTMLKDIAANAVSAPINIALAGTKSALGQTQDLMANAVPFLNPEHSVSPADILSLQLLRNDRYQDKRMRLIDMLSAPDFASYPARQIEKAVEDTIATNPNMATPRYREYLKAEVASRLLAGNRTNRADQAATADIINKVTESDKNLAEQSAETEVENLSDTKYGGADNSLGKALSSVGFGLDKLTVNKILPRDLEKDFDALIKEIGDESKAKKQLKQSEKKRQLAAVQKYMKDYNKLVLSFAQHNKTKSQWNRLSIDDQAKQIQKAKAEVATWPKEKLSLLLGVDLGSGYKGYSRGGTGKQSDKENKNGKQNQNKGKQDKGSQNQKNSNEPKTETAQKQATNNLKRILGL